MDFVLFGLIYLKCPLKGNFVEPNSKYGWHMKMRSSYRVVIGRQHSEKDLKNGLETYNLDGGKCTT